MFSLGGAHPNMVAEMSDDSDATVCGEVDESSSPNLLNKGCIGYKTRERCVNTLSEYTTRQQLLLLVNSTGVRVLAVNALESRRISQELSNNLIF